MFLEAINENNPNTIPDASPTTGPVISIINLGEPGSGIFAIMAASFG